MKNHLKTIAMIALGLVLMLSLSGCMRSNNEPQTTAPEATVMPSTTDGLMPVETNAPDGAVGATDAPEGGVVGERFDWKAKAALVENRINLFSEIAESRVVAYEQTALVGVRFANQYKGEMTQRIRDMIAGEVMAADANIQVVAVTADTADVETIYELADRMKTGVDEATLREDIDKIVRNATTLR